MNKKLEILIRFLKKSGFIDESEYCKSLIKSAIPLMDNPFVGTKTDFKVHRKDLKNTKEHGWVYVLKTEPTVDGDGNKNSEYAWYVGSTGSPAIRWVEHYFGTKRTGETTYAIQNPANIEESVMSALEKEERVKGSRFTTKHKALEVVCLELIDFNGDISDKIARERREYEVFKALVPIVGSANIGGDFNQMLWARKENIPALYTDESEIKSKIKEIVNCNKSEVLTSGLNKLKYEDITDDDLSIITNRRKYFDLNKRKEWRARKSIYKQLEALNDSEKESRADFIKETFYQNDSIEKVLKILGLNNKEEFLSSLSALGIDWQALKDEKLREKYLWALNNSYRLQDARKLLGLSPGSPTFGRMIERLNIDHKKEIGKNVLFYDDHRLGLLEHLLKNETKLSPVARRMGLSRDQVQALMERGGIDPSILGSNYHNRIMDVVRSSSTIEEVAEKLDISISNAKKRSKNYGINIREELGKNLSPDPDIGPDVLD